MRSDDCAGSIHAGARVHSAKPHTRDVCDRAKLHLHMLCSVKLPSSPVTLPAVHALETLYAWSYIATWFD